MKKVILVTGATDGIGLETAKLLSKSGHHILLHGRNAAKLEKAAVAVGGDHETYQADLSVLSDVVAMADVILEKHDRMDVLINNAGIFKTSAPFLPDGQDVRFVVNTVAPYILTQKLLPIIPKGGRVVNLSSAAQASVNLNALKGEVQLSDMEAYAQSKLALTMWSRHMAGELPNGPSIIAVNPGSLLASKMVKEGFGVAGNDLSIGAEILHKAALSDAFAEASGLYFDNDLGRFNDPHPDGLDAAKCGELGQQIEALIS